MITDFFKYSNALMFLTSLHHVYGAYIYDTPWRLHVLALSLPVIAFSVVAANKYSNGILLYTGLLVNLIGTISLIGLYEGVYNHLVKNILFFTGTSAEIMLRLFPAPKYVMPNDFLFELTGVLQGLIVIPLLHYFFDVVVWLRSGYSQSKYIK